MATKVKVKKDFEKNELLNVVIENLSSAPSNPVMGQKYFNTTDKCEYYYNGTAWVKQLAESAIDHNNIANRGTNSHSTIDSHLGSTSNPHSVTKTQVSLGNVDNVQQLPMSYLDTDGALTSNSDTKVPSQKAVKTYVGTMAGAAAGAMIYKGTIDGSQTIAANGITAIQLGWFWKVSVAGTATGIDTPSNAGLLVGDMVIANASKTSEITAADFDGIDNTEAANIVRLTSTQTLTNKTIDADSNTISNLETDNFKANVIDTDGTLAADSDTRIATQKAVKTYINQVGIIQARYKVETITNANTGTVTRASHGCGYHPLVQVYETSGTNTVLVEADVSIDQGGGVTWTTNSLLNGFIVIIGR
jgi:hypothetical protein